MEQILRYFPNLTPLQIENFSKLESLYQDWNAKINVISRKDIDQLYTNHVLHSLAIAKVQSFVPKSSVLDIGTGGGFPGIPLAILFPEVDFVLIDIIAKKIKVVNEVIQALGLKNVKAHQTRAEKLTEKFDFIVSRAVTNMPDFVTWTAKRFKTKHQNTLPNGILYLKGGDLAEELQPFPDAKIYDIKDFFTEEFFETKKVVYLKV